MSSGPLAFQTNAARGRSVACASEKGVPKSFERLATAIGSQPLHQEKPFSTRPGHSMPRIRIQTAVRRRSVFNSLVLGLAFVHSLNHVKGTLGSGHITDLWVRWTACFRR